MKHGSEMRVCKNKKCQKVLPADYKYSKCEACRNQQVNIAKTLTKIGSGIVGIASLAAVIINKGKKN